MDIISTAKEISNSSFIAWVKNKTLQKYFVILAILEILFAIAIFPALLELTTALSQISETQFELIFEAMFSFYNSIQPFTIISVIIISFFSYKIIQVGLKLSKRKSIQINFSRYLKFLFYPIFASLAAIFSIFDLRYLAVGAVGGLITLIGGATLLTQPALGGLIILLGFVFLFVYLIIVIINSIKLMFGQIIYIEKKRTIFESLKESFAITDGNVVNLILFGLIFGVMIFLISIIISLPNMLYVQFILPADANTLTVFNDIIYQLLLIPSYLLGAYSIICSNLFIVKVYSKIKAKN